MDFSVKINRKDLFLFNMFHTYTHSTGWVSIILGGFAIGFGIYQWSRSSNTLYNLLYIGAGLLLLVYIPVTLWLRAGAQVRPGAAFSKEIRYTCDNDKLNIMIGEDTAEMPWNTVWKLKNLPSMLLIYTSRVNAFIIPKRCITKDIEDSLTAAYKGALEA